MNKVMIPTAVETAAQLKDFLVNAGVDLTNIKVWVGRSYVGDYTCIWTNSIHDPLRRSSAKIFNGNIVNLDTIKRQVERHRQNDIKASRTIDLAERLKVKNAWVFCKKQGWTVAYTQLTETQAATLIEFSNMILNE